MVRDSSDTYLVARERAALAFVFLACIGCATRTGSASSTIAAKPPLLQTIDLETGLHLRRVARDAYEITHALPWPANSLLVEMADGTLVLVGTPYTPEATRRLLAWARSRFGERRNTLEVLAREFEAESGRR
jgi:hypothetical protein